MSKLDLHFSKMHGIGNDFVLLDNPAVSESELPDVVRRLCDRHFGVGADGVLIVGHSDLADVRMRIFNADGSEAQMCGNGIRCVGKYIYESGICRSLSPSVETESGIKTLRLHLSPSGSVESVTVDMGRAEHYLAPGMIDLTTSCGSVNLWPVTTGNPHGVVFVDNIHSLPIETIGPELENASIWPDRANIEFISIMSDNLISQRTWERGAGETLACGTGACAAAFAFTEARKGHWPVTVLLMGGELLIDRDPATGNLLMTGPASFVFSAEISLSL